MSRPLEPASRVLPVHSKATSSDLRANSSKAANDELSGISASMSGLRSDSAGRRFLNLRVWEFGLKVSLGVNVSIISEQVWI